MIPNICPVYSYIQMIRSPIFCPVFLILRIPIFCPVFPIQTSSCFSPCWHHIQHWWASPWRVWSRTWRPRGWEHCFPDPLGSSDVATGFERFRHFRSSRQPTVVCCQRSWVDSHHILQQKNSDRARIIQWMGRGWLWESNDHSMDGRRLILREHWSFHGWEEVDFERALIIPWMEGGWFWESTEHSMDGKRLILREQWSFHGWKEVDFERALIIPWMEGGWFWESTGHSMDGRRLILREHWTFHGRRLMQFQWSQLGCEPIHLFWSSCASYLACRPCLVSLTCIFSYLSDLSRQPHLSCISYLASLICLTCPTCLTCIT